MKCTRNIENLIPDRTEVCKTDQRGIKVAGMIRTVVDDFCPALGDVVDLYSHVGVALNGRNVGQLLVGYHHRTLPPSVASTFLYSRSARAGGRER